MEEEFIQQVKEQIVKLEDLDEASFVYEEISIRANRGETIEQLINELNEKFIDILKKVYNVNNTDYFDFKISFASDNKDLTEKDIVPTRPISLLLNVFNNNGNEKLINDLYFKIKIREANEEDKIREKANLLKNMFKTATLDLTSFSDQKS